jgi:hypothetical protein
VGVDTVVHAEVGHQAVGGGEILSRRALGISRGFLPAARSLLVVGYLKLHLRSFLRDDRL